MSEVPKFDHNKDSMVSESSTGRCLIQDGHQFSMAYFNRETQKMEPEPIYIDPGKKSADELKGTLELALVKIDSAIKDLKKVHQEIMYNVPDLFATELAKEERAAPGPGRPKKTSTDEIPPGFKKGAFGRLVPIVPPTEEKTGDPVE